MIPRNAHTDLRELFTTLVRFQIELWDAIDARLRSETDLPLGSLQTLQIIDGTPGCRVLDIAEQLVITIGGASKVVDRVEARGFCERAAHPQDRRSSLLVLTPSGRSALVAGEVVLDDELDRRLGSAATPADLHHLTTTLAQLRRGATVSSTRKDAS